MVRLHYIDRLRWMSILVLFPFHAAFIFSAGWYGYYVLSGSSLAAAHYLTVSIEPWIMPLLFAIAGISARFALRKRSPRMYLEERVARLLVPFLAGLVLICPVIAYYALKFHTGYTGSFAGAFFHFFGSIATMPAGNGLSGDFSVDHLWFILFLFAISVVALGMILAGQRQARLRINPENVTLPALCLLFIPVWLLNFIGLNVTGYSFFAYLAFFLIGYSLLAPDPVQAKLETYWLPLLAVWIILTVGVMWVGGVIIGHSELFWGSSPAYVLTGWTGVLALLGAGRHFLNSPGPFTAYMAAASYPVYIIHQAVLVGIAYYVLTIPVSPAFQYFGIVILSLGLTFACYEILRRIPGVRALFGIAVVQKSE